MKKLLLLAGSIMANVTLGFLVFSHPGSAAVEDRVIHTGTETSGCDKTAVADPVDPRTWDKLGNGDPADVAARLRAEGFPPLLQRAILTGVIGKRFADRHQALNDLIAGGQWWRDGFSYTANIARVRIASRRLEHDERIIKGPWIIKGPCLYFLHFGAKTGFRYRS